jgi:alkenylglycerophosphocholine/alkenylglycerophosphoethanolamine hydrolase
VTEASRLLLGLALLISALDWIAVAREARALEYVCKPAAALAFLGTAIALDPAANAARVSCCIALGFCVLGDIFLMQRKDAFVAGLAAFTIAQIFFTVSFALQTPTLSRLLVGLILTGPCVVLLARRYLRALVAADQSGLVRPVTFYMTVIAAMVVSAITGGSGFGIAGALLFLASDSLIAEQRFIEKRAWQPVAIMVSYHLALAGLVIGLV